MKFSYRIGRYPYSSVASIKTASAVFARRMRRPSLFCLVCILMIFLLSAGQGAIICDTYEKKELCTQMKEECSAKEVFVLSGEMKCFPIAEKNDADSKNKGYVYENGYGTKRTYGGDRTHEGIDIIATENTAGIIPVCAVADGVVERIGWNRLGGYRVGIRSRAGYYYYYAHLDSYASGLKEGSRVTAGQKLGMMGNTGYGKEGTKGKFVVHLHFGIYQDKEGEECSLNPYYLLKYMEKQ